MLGERIRRLRLAMRLSQKQLAGEEMSRAFISQVESGKCTPSPENLEVIAQRLGKPIAYFLSAAAEVGDETLQVLALVESAERDLTMQPGSDRTERMLQQALKLIGPLDQPDLEARIRELLVRLYRHQGRYEELLEQAELGVDLYKAAGARESMARMYAWMGEAALRTEEYPAARRAYEKAALYSSGLKTMLEFRTSVLMYLGSCLFRLGRLPEAAARYEEAFQEAASLDAPVLSGRIAMGLGWSLYQSANLPEALRWTRLAVAEFERGGSPLRVLAMHNLGIIQAARGHWEESYVTMRSCLETYRSQGRLEKQASALEEIARYWRHKGTLNKAEAACWEALDLLDTADDGVLRGRLYRMLGLLLVQKQQGETARHYLRMSVDLLRRLKAEREVAESLAALQSVSNPTNQRQA